VNLEDARYALVIITISLDHEAIKSKDVEIINQICPGDFTNNCYTSPGMFTLSAAYAPPDSKNESCRAPFKDLQNCVLAEYERVAWVELSNIERQIFRRGTHNLNLVRVSTDFTL
jgi:hypothetical protein